MPIITRLPKGRTQEQYQTASSWGHRGPEGHTSDLFGHKETFCVRMTSDTWGHGVIGGLFTLKMYNQILLEAVRHFSYVSPLGYQCVFSAGRGIASGESENIFINTED
eukprot:scaffold19713_cov47-Cyclotella_meneghiniana.AAC.7